MMCVEAIFLATSRGKYYSFCVVLSSYAAQYSIFGLFLSN
uniref:Uncharacterized protein n=1 Tax=Arundo donax TaxID=35708 RepID=A0A0A9H0M2_ARUDO